MTGDEVTSYGDTGPMGSTHPTGMGLSPDTLMAAGVPGTPLPPRPARAAANNASRVSGIDGMPADDAADGVVDMRVSVPWQV